MAATGATTQVSSSGLNRICLSLPSKRKKGVKLQKKCEGLKKLNRPGFGENVGRPGRGVTLPGPPAEPNSYERDAIDEQKERGD